MSAPDDSSQPEPVKGRVVVVGVCAAGKSTLVRRLTAAGYDARSCAQEHSFVADMWQRLSRPEVLVYLDATLDTIHRRRDTGYEAAYIDEQRRRLRHARAHCHLYLPTDTLTPAEVAEEVVGQLEYLGVTPASSASAPNLLT